MSTSSAPRMSDNGSTPTVELLDDEGMVSDKLLGVLAYIFTKYSTPSLPTPTFTSPPRNAYLSPAGLDAFATATNGAPFDQATKKDIAMFFDCVEQAEDGGEGGLSWAGFEQMFTLQSENDPEETYKDIAKHGFDRSLELVNQSKTQ